MLIIIVLPPQLIDRKPLAVILGVNCDTWPLSLVLGDDDLHFCVGVHCDIEDTAMAGKPRVGPTAVITDPNRRDAVDQAIASSGRHDVQYLPNRYELTQFLQARASRSNTILRSYSAQTIRRPSLARRAASSGKSRTN
jgi:hypothetical protein